MSFALRIGSSMMRCSFPSQKTKESNFVGGGEGGQQAAFFPNSLFDRFFALGWQQPHQTCIRGETAPGARFYCPLRLVNGTRAVVIFFN